MAVKKRCNVCLTKLRADGTCPNPECPRYVAEDEPKEKKSEKGGK